jgi:PAS domain S-box-containing protein
MRSVIWSAMMQKAEENILLMSVKGSEVKPLLRVLHLEDSVLDAELIRKNLTETGIPCEVTRVETREEYENALTNGIFDLILADYTLPSFDGLSALSIAMEKRPDIPFVFVSGAIGADRAIETLKLGALDCVLKDKLSRLAPRLQRALEEAEDRMERKYMEQALLESEQRYRRLVETVTNYIYTVRLEHGKPASTTHGHACVHVTGYTAEEYDADPYLWYSMIHPDDREVVEKQVQRILRGEDAFPIEHRITHKDRSTRWIRNTIVPKFDDCGRLVAYDGLVVDITERKKAEETIKEYSLKLEAKVQERTRELEQSRQEIEHAKLQSEAANRAKTDFLANMSHELRTPLNSVLGFSEILLDELIGKLNKKQKDYVNNIYSSGKHLLSLINDILDLAKVESGKLELELSPVILKNSLSASITMLREKAMRHGITMILDSGPDTDGEIIVDERKLKQILFNLLSNAVKFTPDGGSVRISARRVPGVEPRVSPVNARPETAASQQNGGFIEISIADSGIGIRQEEMQRLFKPFLQLESTYTKTYEGTGLGLAITKRLVEFLGGTIRAESDFGKGSRFTVVLPLKQQN